MLNVKSVDSVIASIHADGERVGGVAAFIVRLLRLDTAELVQSFSISTNGSALAEVVLANLGSASYNVTVYAKDVVGNVDTVGVSNVFTVDALPPISSLSFLSSNPRLFVHSDAAIDVSAFDTQLSVLTLFDLNGSDAWIAMAMQSCLHFPTLRFK